MNNNEKITKNICVYCDGELIDVPLADKKNCKDCDSHYWFRDDEHIWEWGKSDKLIKQEISLEFRDIISHGLLGSNIKNVNKETWDMIFDACAEYAFKLL